MFFFKKKVKLTKGAHPPKREKRSHLHLKLLRNIKGNLTVTIKYPIHLYRKTVPWWRCEQKHEPAVEALGNETLRLLSLLSFGKGNVSQWECFFNNSIHSCDKCLPRVGAERKKKKKAKKAEKRWRQSDATCWRKGEETWAPLPDQCVRGEAATQLFVHPHLSFTMKICGISFLLLYISCPENYYYY